MNIKIGYLHIIQCQRTCATSQRELDLLYYHHHSSTMKLSEHPEVRRGELLTGIETSQRIRLTQRPTNCPTHSRQPKLTNHTTASPRLRTPSLDRRRGRVAIERVQLHLCLESHLGRKILVPRDVQVCPARDFIIFDHLARFDVTKDSYVFKELWHGWWATRMRTIVRFALSGLGKQVHTKKDYMRSKPTSPPRPPPRVLHLVAHKRPLAACRHAQLVK